MKAKSETYFKNEKLMKCVKCRREPEMMWIDFSVFLRMHIKYTGYRYYYFYAESDKTNWQEI